MGDELNHELPRHGTQQSGRSQLPPSLRLPVFAAPMFLVSGVDLVVAACRAGVVGSFPTTNCRTVGDLDVWMGSIAGALAAAASETAQRTPAPWAVNLITHSSNARLAEDLKLVAEYRPPIVITALGSPRPVMEVVKGYGGMVIADVVNLALARKAADAGADGLACIAAGAGGHTGQLSPFAFIATVREFFDGPIVVGGAISSGAGIAGAIAAGADAIYMGTRFIPSRESLAPEAYKQMIVDHGTGDLVVSDAITGTAASWLRPSLVANGLDPDDLGRPPGERNYDSSQSPAKRWKDTWAAGQGLQTIRAIQPVADIVAELEQQYEAAVDRFATLTAGHRIDPR
ncbi:NAD(P)H-dependent flavin oxidoreductase [Pelagerythrobacter marinus]|uniref:NAD(P)H-dependent flavin oxidoreductase n=1 Tax=Pelagerythrobacter marinus TaxID=538382 RepID=UPI0020372C36|nr:nitronate monooxygenase [Pelagerythrobacter marinus]USA39441.1 nitronate monooxygenase [Pelagerythrobacter marinus]WPZ06419.1 nitronate monooxygenase [Pelagerythrobacter marinus]